MCGIVGYVGSREAAPLVFEGLRRLEYRGYDSAGIAVIQQCQIGIRRDAGNLDNLARLLEAEPMAGQIGIGHTRWATHGFVYFLAIYLESLGATPVQIGGILGIAGAALALTHLPAGALSDVVSRRAMMIVSWALGTVAALMMFAATTLATFSIGLVIYFMTSFVMAPLSSYIASGRGEWLAARALTHGLRRVFGGGDCRSSPGWAARVQLGVRPLFGIASVIFIFSTSLILLIRSQPREPSEPGQRYRALLRNGRLARFLPLAFLALFAMYLSWPLTPNYLQSTRGVSLSALGANPSCSATNGGRSPVPTASVAGGSSRPTGARSSSMRWATCRATCR